MVIAIDFDGTIVRHEYPLIGDPVPGALEVIRELIAADHRVMLWTMRDGNTLDDAVEYMTRHGIKLWGINHNPDQHTWNTNKSKQYAHVYIDDAALGCPLVQVSRGRSYVDWTKVREWLWLHRILK